jgi:predicted DNA-binding mobile mystery protein A
MSISKLQIQLLNSKLAKVSPLKQISKPDKGWLFTIRQALGISLEQVASKAKLSKQAIQNLEKREQLGTISMNKLAATAGALNMQMVYFLIPKDESLNDLIEKKAQLLATEIVMRTSQTMKLEDQENDKKRITKAIKEQTKKIVDEMPKILWD